MLAPVQSCLPTGPPHTAYCGQGRCPPHGQLLAPSIPVRPQALPMQPIIDSLAKADALPEALPMVDAWLQQQEEELAEDANTRVPLQVGSYS